MGRRRKRRSIREWVRDHREGFRTFFEILDAGVFIAAAPVTALGAYFMDESSLPAAIVTALIAFFGSVRMWIKKSPIARRLGIEHTSQDLPRVEVKK